MQELLKDKNYAFRKNNDDVPDLRSNSTAKIPPSDLIDRNVKSIVLGGNRKEECIRWIFSKRGVSGNDRLFLGTISGNLGVARIEIILLLIFEAISTDND